jgi:hypothetical protein
VWASRSRCAARDARRAFAWRGVRERAREGMGVDGAGAKRVNDDDD